MAKRERATPVVHDNGFTLNGCTFHVEPKYQPLDAIGQGSYGVVCSVKNSETGEKLAIKKITPMAGDEWDATHTLREIRLMRCLGAHENVREQWRSMVNCSLADVAISSISDRSSR
jgi:serine/threonine protein kinase